MTISVDELRMQFIQRKQNDRRCFSGALICSTQMSKEA